MFGLGKKKDAAAPVSGAAAWQDIVSQYTMQPHPKGGYYRETYRSPGLIPYSALAARGHKGDRAFSTAILYLLPGGAQTMLNRLKSDELLHFYLGGPMTLVKIMPNGIVVEVTMGHDVADGHQVQHVVEAGCWFSSYCNPGTPYSLIGCTVAPGFDFADFEMPNRAALIKEFPQAKDVIERFASSPSGRG